MSKHGGTSALKFANREWFYYIDHKVGAQTRYPNYIGNAILGRNWTEKLHLVSQRWQILGNNFINQ